MPNPAISTAFLQRSQTVVPAIQRYDEAAPGVHDDQKAPVNICSYLSPVCSRVLSFRSPPLTTSAKREEVGRLVPPYYGCRFVRNT